MIFGKKNSTTTFILILAFLILFIPTVTAIGCCQDFIEYWGHEAACYNDGDSYSFELRGYQTVNASTCEPIFGGTWTDGVACSDISACDVVCCCDADDQVTSDQPETPTYACAEEKGYSQGTLIGDTCSCVSSTWYLIEGYIMDASNNLLPNVPITITYDDSSTTTTKSVGSGDTLGSYYILSEHKPIRVDATNITCTGLNSSGYNISTTYYFNVTLDTCEDNGGEEPVEPVEPIETCDEEYTCSFPLGETCGVYTCVPVDPECGEEYTSIVPCGSVGGTCNDGTLDTGEECDCSDSNDPSTCQYITSYFDAPYCTGGDTFGNLACQGCRVDTSDCTTCPAPGVEFCTQAQCDMGCTACDDMCQESVCEEPQPQLEDDDVAVSISEGSQEIEVSWSISPDCLENYVSMTLKRCADVDGECVPTDTIETLGVTDISGQTSFVVVDDELVSGTQFCYQVESVINIGGGETEINKSDIKCAYTGNQICYDYFSDQTCLYGEPNQIMGCTEEGIREEVSSCGENEICIGPDTEGLAHCQQVGVCEQCNGLFGLYQYLSTDTSTAWSVAAEIVIDGESIEGTYSCGDDNFIQWFSSKTSQQPPLCYNNGELTVADSLDACAEISGCYDYRNQNSCEENLCGLEETSNCQWNEFGDLGGELGLGVCVPTTDGEEDCSRCDTDNYLLPTCTDDLCSIYAVTDIIDGEEVSRCYASDTGGCTSKNELACQDYNTQDDCGIINANTSVTYAESVISTYYPYPSRTNGTNIIQPSNDLFGLGTCQWVPTPKGGTCVKNADNFTSDNTPYDDCKLFEKESKEAQILCGQDNQSPETEIIFLGQELSIPWWDQSNPTYSSSNFAESILLQVSDDTYSEDDVWTYFGVNQTTEPAYPTVKFEQFNQEYFTSGSYLLSYYSEDSSHNLEEINSAVVSFDNEAPQSTSLVIENSSYEINKGTADAAWKTDITIDYTLNEPHGPVKCEGWLDYVDLSGEPNNGFGGDDTLLSSYTDTGSYSFSQSYQLLEDGFYTFSYYCSDHPFLNNLGPNTEEFVIEADQRITDVYPQMGSENKFNDNLLSTTDYVINMTLTSARNATCYIGLNGENEPVTKKEDNENVIEMSTNDGLEHYYELDVGTDADDGIYYYYTGCEFTEGTTETKDTIVEGNNADAFVFSIDRRSPQSELYDKSTGEVYPIDAPYQESLHLQIACEDNHRPLKLLSDPNNESTLIWNGNFGVARIEYCFTDEPELTDPCSHSTVVYAESVDIPVSFDTINAMGGNYLYYTCVDQGNNEESWNENRINIKSLEFILDDIVVWSPDGECLYGCS